MWLFLATEIMFFTGLIGSYVVLRAGSPSTAFSNLFPPATDLTRLGEHQGVRIVEPGANHEKVAELFRDAMISFRKSATLPPEFALHDAEELIEWGQALTPGLPPEDAKKLAEEFQAAGATVELEGLKTYNWPLPYDTLLNPLSIDLTAANTFFLICSSVTMVFALAAVQRGHQAKFKAWLFATVCIGTLFVSIQAYEYRSLGFSHPHAVGISRDGHFRPDSSLFGSCFYVMTGFHGAHVTGGVILLLCVWIAALRGRYSPMNYSTVELAGLYWHFVDLVWILLFTVVYLI